MHFGARIGDDVATSLTRRTSAGNAEKSLLIANLPASVARTASGWTFTRCGAGSVTIFASLVTANRHPGFRSEVSFLEFERQILAQIGAALNPAATASAGAGTPTKHVAESEELAEDIAEILEHRRIECRHPARQLPPSPAWP